MVNRAPGWYATRYQESLRLRSRDKHSHTLVFVFID